MDSVEWQRKKAVNVRVFRTSDFRFVWDVWEDCVKCNGTADSGFFIQIDGEEKFHCSECADRFMKKGPGARS